MMYPKKHLPDIEQWSQSSGSNVIPRRARPGLAGLRPHSGGVAEGGRGCTPVSCDVPATSTIQYASHLRTQGNYVLTGDFK